MTTCIRVDWENNADAWWAAARDLFDDWRREVEAEPGALPPLSTAALAALTELLEPGASDFVHVDDPVASELLAWSITLPGWNDGPEYARHPLLFQPLEQLEELR